MDPLAVYASVVATASLAWQIYQRVQARKPDLEVQVRHDGPFGPMMVEADSALGSEQGRRSVPQEYELQVVVINHGESSQYVEAIGINPAQPVDHREPPFWYHECHEKIDPNARLTHKVPVSGLMPAGRVGGAQFIAFADLASGRRFEARPDEVTADFIRLSEQNQA